MRLVSCVPSISELIYHLNPGSLFGRTRFCIYPYAISTIPVIGGTKNLNLNKIKQLNPDLIIGTKEENEQNQFDELSKEFSTRVFDIKKIEDAISCIQEIGILVNQEEKARDLVNQIQIEREKFRILKSKSAIYIIWKNPWMTVGGDTFINTMMEEAGLENLFKSRNRYPEINLEEEVRRLNPDLLILSSEPFPFKNHNVEELSKLFPDNQVILVDGTYFSWYGSRIKSAYEYFSKMLENQSGFLQKSIFNPE